MDNKSLRRAKPSRLTRAIAHFLSLAQINNLGSDLSLAPIAKIARCLQVFVSTRCFLSIGFNMEIYPLYNAVFGVQYSKFPYHPSPGMVIAARHRSHNVLPTRFIKCYQKNELTSMCIMFKCHMLLYVELNKTHVHRASYFRRAIALAPYRSCKSII